MKLLIYFFKFDIINQMLEYIDLLNQEGSYKLSKLTKVNIISGRNNSGKTSILKKIYERFNETSYLWNTVEIENLIINLENNLFIIKQRQELINLMINPENNLYPDLQQQLPIVLKRITNILNIQFIISTNSPFLIASSSKISDSERLYSLRQKKLFIPSQKIFLLEEGKVLANNNLKGFIHKQSEMGFWGKKANLIASKILIDGLSWTDKKNNLIEEQNYEDKKSPYLILCEGENSESDALIYNQIFPDYKGRSVLFVSCKSNTELSINFEVFRQIKNSLSANFNLLMLRDRDHEFANNREIENYTSEYPGRKVLFKRAIECYLYNSETASLLLNLQNEILDPIYKNLMDDLQQSIQSEAENGHLGHDYKSRLKLLFRKATKNYKFINPELTNSNKNKFSVKILAKLITSNTQTYKDLESAIFY
jgi:hypothetical protein